MARRSPAAKTAFGPMVIAAVEQYNPVERRVVDDELAVRFLPARMRLMVRACASQRLREAAIRASERKAPGVWGGVLGRKRYADEQVTKALLAGLEQVVILGAGLDTRAYRLVAPAGADAFEVDLQENIAYKRRRLQAIYGDTAWPVTLLPVDFAQDDFAKALASKGFWPSEPTMFVWEAVTQYLSEDGVRNTLSFLAKTAAPGSRLVFTYVLRDFLEGRNSYGAEQLYQEFVAKHQVWEYGLLPDEVRGLLDEYGWEEREQVGAEEYISRYFEPIGRSMPVMTIERFVFAVKV